MHTRSRTALGALTAMALALATVAPVAAAGSATYEVTITNLSSGQPLTPPIVAIHRGSTNIFDVGSAASVGIQQLAENGNGGPLLNALAANSDVTALESANAPLVGDGSPGEAHGFTDSVTFTIETSRDGRFLSFASMLICTNDGFTGVDRLRLPATVGATVLARTAGYDAGTELNTESYADIVPPCQLLSGLTPIGGTGTTNPALAEQGVIHHHAGIVGGADLVPGFHGWTNPVTTIVVTRVG